MSKPHWAFIEIANMTDNPDPLLPGYRDQEDEEGNLTPWTWQAWCDQPTKGGNIERRQRPTLARQLLRNDHSD